MHKQRRHFRIENFYRGMSFFNARLQEKFAQRPKEEPKITCRNYFAKRCCIL